MVLSSLISCLTYPSLLLARPILLKRLVLPPVPFSHVPDTHLVRRWVPSASSAHVDWLLHNVRKNWQESMDLSMHGKDLSSWGKADI